MVDIFIEKHLFGGTTGGIIQCIKVENSDCEENRRKITLTFPHTCSNLSLPEVHIYSYILTRQDDDENLINRQ
jgi:hypothetical protein